MPSPTYTPLANITLGSSASSVTFSSIPATYRDLVLVARTNVSSGAARLRLNGDTNDGNYTEVRMYGVGTSAVSDLTNPTAIDIGGLGNPHASLVQIMDYSATDKHKTGLMRLNASNVFVSAHAFRWANTGAVNTVAIIATVSLASGSTFALYGIAA